METSDDEFALLKVAESVSDGIPVDWSSEAGLREAGGNDLAPLQLLEKVAAAYRSTAHPRNRENEPAARESGALQGTSTRWPAATSASGEKPSHQPQARILGWALAGAALLVSLLLLALWLRQ